MDSRSNVRAEQLPAGREKPGIQLGEEGLGPADVRIWAVTTADPPVRLDALVTLLSADEVQRADRLVHPEDRARFILARGTLRILLGEHLNRDPAAIRFRYEPKGKPLLEPPDDVGFSVSHSGEWVVIGMADGGRVGVDIEKIRPLRHHERVASRYFCAAEVEALEGIPGDERLDAFFACWTRKEASVKAVGGGVSMGLNRFTVSLEPSARPEILEVEGSRAAARQWTLWSGSPAADYLAALAVDRPDAPVTARRWLGSTGVQDWE